MERADIVIIGSGQGAGPLAKELAKDGSKVFLFERAQYGGTCVNYGCLPSKAFLASAHAAAGARGAAKLGIHAQVEVDFDAVMARAREIIHSAQQGVRQELEEAGVHLVNAEASFVDERTVSGDEVYVQAPLIVINTGASSAVPPIDGLQNVDFLTYERFWSLEALPQRIFIVGGGYVGVELGQGLARLGSEVHIFEQSERIIRQEEEDVSQTLTRVLTADGAQIHTQTQVTKVTRRDSALTLDLRSGQRFEGDTLLITVGRKPNTEALNVGAAGIDLNERGYVKVDNHFRTSNPNVYAIGDVTGQAAFTHVSWEDYRRLVAILHGAEREQRDRVLGYAFFTEPEVGRVGLTLDAARKQGYHAQAVTMPLFNVARARLTGQEEGFYRMVVDRETEKILGATLVGPAAGELLHVFMAHMEAGSTWRVLEESVHVHPTFAEGLPVLTRKLM